jgi:mannose-6-phosphate isomerase-like protein (cupin superfamily)
VTDYTRISLSDAPDVLGDYPGEMRFLTGALDAEQSALTYRRMPPGTGGRGSYGHRHKTQEELYLVLEGTLTFKIGDDVFDAPAGTAVRIAPSALRSVHNDGADDVILIITSVKADEYEGEVEMQSGFWPEAGGSSG